MAQRVIEAVRQAGKTTAANRCDKSLRVSDYPAVFSEAEKAIGPEKLSELVSYSLPGEKTRGRLYQMIASWPFCCYLTTNFDDYLERHLKAIGIPVSVRRNAKEDMQLLRASSRDLIMKIHGDPSVPKDIVLTSEQYAQFRKSESRRYWREKILATLHMVDLVIIGYSTSDPDFRDQLERARELAAPDHPIFMFASGIDMKEVRKYFEEYNIRIIPYRNADGAHRDLYRLLSTYDAFVAKRESANIGLAEVDESAAILASSIHIFTQLHIYEGSEQNCIRNACSAMILQILSEQGVSDRISMASLIDLLKDRVFAASHVDPGAVQSAVDHLYNVGFISISDDPPIVVVEAMGHTAISEMKGECSLLHEKFEGACEYFLKREYSELEEASIKSIIQSMQSALVRVFQQRGMEIAKVAFLDDVLDLTNATDILKTINASTVGLARPAEARAFADLVIEILLRPSEAMKAYLAMLSQGYFAYHSLGLDPDCSQERLDMAKEKTWILDSNVLISLLAVDCLNYGYAQDLLSRMQTMGLKCITTNNLFDEALDHAYWAITNFSTAPIDSMEMLEAALGGPGYKQNLFVDGFYKWAVGQGNPTLHQYMVECVGPDYRTKLAGSLRSRISDLQVEIHDFNKWPNFNMNWLVEREHLAGSIQDLRSRFGTFRSEAQCNAEAEVVLLCETGKLLFLSQSNILDKLHGAARRMTWKPEAMYRFLSLFSVTPAQIDLLYQCMIEDFFFAGFDIVDTQVIKRSIAPTIRQARMQLDQEKQAYETTLGEQRLSELTDAFDKVPDEQKPFYTMQFAFYVARQAIKGTEAAETRVKIAEQEKGLILKEKTELERLRWEKAERKRKQEKAKLKAQKKAKRKGKGRKKRK
ncbi:MAG: SIR2 family protein [Dehalococcoidia bacterium]|nr:SIR2 family protein [Dehalococcoidia bacterium]